MMTVWDRRNPRISYQVPVGVIDTHKKRVFSVTSVNVSAGGMFVDSEELLSPGSMLVCNLPLHGDREAVQIQGRVAWIRPTWASDNLRPRGMGIEFVDLSDEQSDKLKHIIGDVREQSHAVRLSVKGLRTPINARAQLTPEGIFLRAPLPFLEIGAEVDFCFQDDNVDSSYRGRIANVAVHADPDHPVPRLQVEVELTSIGERYEIPTPQGEVSGDSEDPYEAMMIEASESMQMPVMSSLSGPLPAAIPEIFEPRDTEQTSVLPEAVSLAIDEAEPLWPPAAPQPVPPSGLDEDVSASAPQVMFHMESAPGFSPIVEMVDPSLWQESQSIPHVVLPTEGPTVASEPITFSFPEEGRRGWYIVGVVGVVAILALAATLWPRATGKSGRGEPAALMPRPEDVARAKLSQSPPNEHAPSSLDKAEISAPIEGGGAEAAAFERVKAAAVGDEAAATGERVEPTAPKAKAARKSVAPTQPRGLRFEAIGRELTFTLPIRGSIEDANHYVLADPPAVAINLPKAQPVGGFVDVEPERDGVRLVWIRERLGGTHWRVFFQGATPSCEVDIAEDAVRMRCRR